MEEGKILEAISRVIARIDGLERRLEDLRRDITSLAATVYAQCLLERRGPGKIMRVGLPRQVDAILIAGDKAYVALLRPVATRDEADRIKRIAPHVAALAGVEAASIVPTIVTGRYLGGEPPEGVDVIVC